MTKNTSFYSNNGLYFQIRMRKKEEKRKVKEAKRKKVRLIRSDLLDTYCM